VDAFSSLHNINIEGCFLNQRFAFFLGWLFGLGYFLSDPCVYGFDFI